MVLAAVDVCDFGGGEGSSSSNAKPIHISIHNPEHKDP